MEQFPGQPINIILLACSGSTLQPSPGCREQQVYSKLLQESDQSANETHFSCMYLTFYSLHLLVVLIGEGKNIEHEPCLFAQLSHRTRAVCVSLQTPHWSVNLHVYSSPHSAANQSSKSWRACLNEANRTTAIERHDPNVTKANPFSNLPGNLCPLKLLNLSHTQVFAAEIAACLASQ